MPHLLQSRTSNSKKKKSKRDRKIKLSTISRIWWVKCSIKHSSKKKKKLHHQDRKHSLLHRKTRKKIMK
jgi:hypothetical protein